MQFYKEINKNITFSRITIIIKILFRYQSLVQIDAVIHLVWKVTKEIFSKSFPRVN